MDSSLDDCFNDVPPLEALGRMLDEALGKEVTRAGPLRSIGNTDGLPLPANCFPG